MNAVFVKNMNRREFVGKFGMASAASILASHPLFGKAAQSVDRRSVLLETAHFSHTGGWMLDNQFEAYLGFSYLLAHGMGQPVDNASGKVTFPKPGTYTPWVLTKDWCPGDREAPGQFKVLVGDKELTPTFGTGLGLAGRWNG